MSDRTKIADTALPERDCGNSVWPRTVTRVAVSGLATIANGGSQQFLPQPVGALMILGINSGVVFGLTGGSGDQYLPVFHGAIFPVDAKTYWLATQGATADGTAFVAGFESVERALEWKQLLGHVPPQQGALGGTMTITGDVTVAELPAATAIADNEALPTTTRIGAVMQSYDGTNVDLARSDSGSLRMMPHNGSSPAAIVITQDALGAFSGLTTIAPISAWNGGSFDRVRTTDDGETSGIGALLPAYREEYTGGPGKSTNGAVPGTLLSYTVPTGKSATIESITLSLVGAQALTQLAIDVNEASPSQTVRHYLGAAGTSWVFTAPITLNAGDAVLVKLIAAAGAANTADISINARELR